MPAGELTSAGLPKTPHPQSQSLGLSGRPDLESPPGTWSRSEIREMRNEIAEITEK